MSNLIDLLKAVTHRKAYRGGNNIDDKMIIYRCEEVSLGDIKETACKYERSAREVKLRTRAGMGYCGGRTCIPALDAVLEEVTGEKPGDNIPLKVQPPVRPVSMSNLKERMNHA